jgi:hypothetical protein
MEKPPFSPFGGSLAQWNFAGRGESAGVCLMPSSRQHKINAFYFAPVMPVIGVSGG